MKRILALLSIITLTNVTTTNGGEASTSSGTVAVSIQRGGQRNIWRCRPDGMDAKRLTAANGDDVDPRWNPEGTKILFTRLNNGLASILIMNEDGSGQEEVCAGMQASWSPDGESIIFCRDGQVILRHLKDKTEKLISPTMWEECAFPAMSPDSKQVVCSSRHEGRIGIYSISLANGATHRIRTSKEACTPRWSSDGQWLLFQTSNHICRIKPDGTDEEELTFGAGIQHQAQFSPDQKFIIFTRGNTAEGPWQLCLQELSSGNETTVPLSGSFGYPDWKKE